MADETVGRLGAEIYLDDNVSAEAQQIEVSFRAAARGMSDMSNASTGVSASLGLVDVSTGRAVSTFEALQQVGVTTTGQIQAQIAALDLLISKTQDDAVATAQLTARKQGLERALQGSTAKMGGSISVALDAQQAITGLSRAVQGGSRSFTGAIPGLLSFTRNVQAVAIRSKAAGTSVKSGLVGALAGGGGLALALTAAGLAMEFFKEQTEDAEGSVEDLFKLLADLPTVSKIGFDDKALRTAIENQKTLVRGLEDQIRAEEARVRIATLARSAQTQAQRDAVALQAARQQELETERDIQQQLEEGLKAYEAQVGFQERLLNAGGTNLEVQRATEKAQREAAREAEKAARAGERAAKAAERQLAAQNRFIDTFALSVALQIDERAAEKTLGEALARIARRQTILLDNVLIRTPDIDIETGGFEEDIFGEVGAAAIRIDRAMREGLLTTMEALQARSATLRDGLLDLSDAGQQNEVTFELMRRELRRTNAALLAIDVAQTFIDPFSTGLANILFGLEKGVDLLESMKLALRDVVAQFIQAGLTKLVGSIVGGAIGAAFGGPVGAAVGAGAAFTPFRTLSGEGAAISLGTIENRIEGTTLVQVIELTRQIGSA